MNENPAATPITLSETATLLSDPRRWRILFELAKGEALPVYILAQRTGLSPDATSKHMAFLRSIGVAKSGYGRLYTLAPAYRPAPGTNTINLGHCTINLP